MCLKVPFRLAAQTFQLGRRMSSSQKGCGTSVTSSKPVAIGSTSGLESTEAAASRPAAKAAGKKRRHWTLRKMS